MKTIEQLRYARALIQTPDKWCQGSFAEDSSGKDVPIHSPAAYKFCYIGALERVGAGVRSRAQMQTERYLEKKYGSYISASVYNDTTGRTHEEVLALFDGTIAMLEKEANETV